MRDVGVPIDPKLPMLSTYLSNVTCLAAMLSTRCGWRIDRHCASAETFRFPKIQNKFYIFLHDVYDM